jgi:hypothetical protein
MAESKGIYVGLVGRLCVESCTGLLGLSSDIISPVGISGTGAGISAARDDIPGIELLRGPWAIPLVIPLVVPLVVPLGMSSLLYLSSIGLSGGPGTVRLRNHS